MQLENYERSMLANNEEEGQDLLIPIFNGHETNMSTEQNDRSPSLQRGIENNSERVEHNHGAMTHGQRGNRISVNTRLRGRQQHRQRRNKSNSLRRNMHRNNNQTSIPIRHYNSLRIMVPSVASNKNASRVRHNVKNRNNLDSIANKSLYYSIYIWIFLSFTERSI